MSHAKSSSQLLRGVMQARRLQRQTLGVSEAPPLCSVSQQAGCCRLWVHSSHTSVFSLCLASGSPAGDGGGQEGEGAQGLLLLSLFGQHLPRHWASFPCGPAPAPSAPVVPTSVLKAPGLNSLCFEIKNSCCSPDWILTRPLTTVWFWTSYFILCASVFSSGKEVIVGPSLGNFGWLGWANT